MRRLASAFHSPVCSIVAAAANQFHIDRVLRNAVNDSRFSDVGPQEILEAAQRPQIRRARILLQTKHFSSDLPEVLCVQTVEEVQSITICIELHRARCSSDSICSRRVWIDSIVFSGPPYPFLAASRSRSPQ
jgi:hypothetical protein